MIRTSQKTSFVNFAKNLLALQITYPVIFDAATQTSSPINVLFAQKHLLFNMISIFISPSTRVGFKDLSRHNSNNSNLILGDKKHVCHVCDATFTKAYSLKQHLSLHFKDTPELQCNICDFIAPSKQRLKAHIAIHEGKSETSQNTLEEAQFTFMEEEVDEDGDEDGSYSLVESHSTF